ncbi:hypothetical protein M0D21_01240 [Aquimarina sp. D1M17]|uniref:hypothetical protein n=1 Tax=Aquimarina acroporae TaxID=2937283 RepID=UPI0020C12D5F|nr:hypothetical protein [Aquimarina acroporae]MCK8520167.1 hypothetical protein [Aquimarina acroporae]
MINHVKISLIGFALTVLSLRTCVKENTQVSEAATIPVSTEEKENVNLTENKFEEHSKTTRGVLITHCGSCHQSTLDSHKVGAIKIFDLDRGNKWHITLKEEHLDGIANRTQNKNTITDEQKRSISSFLELKESAFK